MDTQKTLKLSEVEDHVLYRVKDLQDILKSQGLNFSIFSIRDAETWKCKNYDCAKRYSSPTDVCSRCGASTNPPIIDSPRTQGGGKGYGHRRYSGKEIKKIVSIFRSRIR